MYLPDHDPKATAPHPSETVATPSGRAKPPAVCYLGFRTTEIGREYRMRVTAGLERRVFVLLIPHAAFAARQARFQDAPDLCFGKLQRELEANPDLLADSRLVVTTEELHEYRVALDRRPPSRPRRRAGG